jgi:hypothetical protein
MSDCPQFLSLFKCDEHRYHGLKFIGERCFFLSFRYQPENRMKNPSYHQKNGTRVYQQHVNTYLYSYTFSGQFYVGHSFVHT